MKYKSKNICLLLQACLLYLCAGCKKQLDINKNPNYPTLEQGNSKLVFPAAVLATAGKLAAISPLSVLCGLNILHRQHYLNNTLL